MPGTQAIIEVLAFDRAPDGGVAQIHPPVGAGSEEEAQDVAQRLGEQHAGAVAIRRDAQPAIGETSPPIVLFQTGEIGDFD